MQHVDPYKTADELGVTEKEREALITVGRELARDDYAEEFSMCGWSTCIYGKVRSKMSVPDNVVSYSGALSEMYIISKPNRYWADGVGMHTATRMDAAAAIQNFLTGTKVTV